MNKSIRLLILLLGALLFSAVASAQIKDGECWEYQGKMGDNTEIGMTLFAKAGKLGGTYFYRKYLKDITISGQYPSGRDIAVDELDASGNVQASFRLRFAEKDPDYKSDRPLTADLLKGNWTKASGGPGLPVRLKLAYSCSLPDSGRYAAAGATSDELVEKNVQGFYFAVLSGDKEEVANRVSFPLSFSVNNESKTVSNRTAFLRYYDAIFTKSFVEKIAKGIPHHMFANWQGIMIADGEVWFDENGKARHFNN